MDDKGLYIVTGATGGIGRALTEGLCRKGLRVVMACRNMEKAEAVRQGIMRSGRAGNGEIPVRTLDMASLGSIGRFAEELRSEGAEIAALVNNAGVAGQALFQDVTDALWERYFAVNLNGARNTIQAVLPHMLHEKAGVIVNISSIWGQHGASCEVTYSCTKHALIGLTRSLAMELAPSGIRVNCVAPGVIDTDMVQVLGPEVLHDLAEQTPLGRLGTPQDIANAVAFLVSEKASFITGQVLTVDGAFVG